jgi:hypothetical protein
MRTIRNTAWRWLVALAILVLAAGPTFVQAQQA